LDTEAELGIVKVKTVDPLSDKRWDEYIYNHPYGTIFHTSVWARTIIESYGYLSRYYIIEDEAGQIRAAMPLYLVKSRLTGNRLVCLPFSDHCFPLVDNGIDIALLINSIKKEIKEGIASYLELKGWQNGINVDRFDLVKRDYNLLYIINLGSSIDEFKKKLHHSVKRGIHQAEQRNVTVRMSYDETDLNQFYKLHVKTRKKLGVLPQPYHFFKVLFRHIIAQNLGFISLAESEGKVIAGVIFLTYKDTIYYKFNASDERYLQKRPNHLITWKSIQYAYANNYQYFDYGRCTLEEEGLRVYKSRWGAMEINLPYYYYPEVKGFTIVPESSLRYRTMNFISHVMPDSVFKMAGSLLYKHLA